MNNTVNLIQNKYVIGKTSVVGDARRKWEDRAAVSEIKTRGGLQLVVGVVADGVGSADNGSRGAELAIQTVMKSIENTDRQSIVEIIDAAIQEANSTLHEENSRGSDGLTTLVVSVIYDGRVYIGNVGDSRAYWVQSSGKMLQLTLDHSYINIYGGSPDADEAGRVVNIIGRDPKVQVDFGFYLKGRDSAQAYRIGVQGLPLKPGETILLCSDGLIKTDRQGRRYASDEEIVEALQTEFMPGRAAVKMVSVAEGRSPDDNVSAVTIQYLTPEIISRVEQQSERARRISMLKKVGAASAVVLLLILALSFGKKAIDTSARLTAMALTPTATSEVIIYTPTPVPSPTPTQPINPGQARIEEIIGDGIVSYSNAGGPILNASAGSFVDPGVRFMSDEKTSLKVTVGESVGQPSVMYIFPSSETILDFENALVASLSQGSIFIQAGNREAQVLLPSHNNALAYVSDGRMIVQIDGADVWVWCFSGNCRLSYKNGDEGFSLSPGDKRVYYSIGDDKGDKEPIEKYSDLVWGWNTSCNDCILDLVYTPTPKPTAVPPTATPTPKKGDKDTPVPTATPVPPTNTHTPKPTDTHTPEPTDTHTPEPTDTPTPTHTPVTPTLPPPNRPPEAKDITVKDCVDSGKPYSIGLSGSDPDDDNITYAIKSDPSHGSVTVNSQSGEAIYTSESGYTGSDSFTYSVKDVFGAESSDASVGIKTIDNCSLRNGTGMNLFYQNFHKSLSRILPDL